MYIGRSARNTDEVAVKLVANLQHAAARSKEVSKSVRNVITVLLVFILRAETYFQLNTTKLKIETIIDGRSSNLFI
jgi:hypothetical protein